MNFTPIEIELCAEWAKEHAEGDSAVDVMSWKLLEVGREKAERSARYHDRVLAEIDADMASLSAKFYTAETPDPNGDESIEF